MIIYRNDYKGLKRGAALIVEPATEPHKHAFFEIALIAKGNSKNVINGMEFPTQSGACFIQRPNDVHYFKDISENYMHCDIYYNANSFEKMCNSFHENLYTSIITNPTPVCYYLPNDVTSMLVKFVQEISFLPQIDTPYSISLHSTILSILLCQYIKQQEYVKQQNANRQLLTPKWITNVYDQLNDINTLLLPIAELAKINGYNPSYFSRAFKKYTKKNLKDVILEKKINYALSLLSANPTLKIIEISEMLEFANPSTFCKHFKNFTGKTAMEFKKAPPMYSDILNTPLP